MAVVSLLVTRFIWTLIPALMFLAFIAYKIHSVVVAGSSNGGGGGMAMEMTGPFFIGTGLILMYQSHRGNAGWVQFWFGETCVIAMFTLNSLGIIPPPSMSTSPQRLILYYGGVTTFAGLAALWFRGKFWNYFIILAMEFFMAVFIALAFPIMEMVLEAIINDKLKKIGDKVRIHHEHMERYYQSKMR